jgi:hypothetical protein
VFGADGIIAIITEIPRRASESALRPGTGNSGGINRTSNNAVKPFATPPPKAAMYDDFATPDVSDSPQTTGKKNIFGGLKKKLFGKKGAE